ncbi:hypothetical protein FHS18_005163 [Paenibacillus phyllosphaerae]|uniref:Uncharacterized protein n=1 Tax=Paenibacillus phyllosphaerae TaxID=274593 RepID=A0A7W5B251_9BACL|nr:hypothetical protein [Paenibacillus phyllosphaerae]MBB3113060.1 hypothetical protein [Paenibacillus phyllosphaerae]
MLSTALSLMLYAAIFYAGSKALSASKRKVELVLFVLVTGWCAYIHIAVLNHWQVHTPVTLQSDLLEYVSVWLR